MIEIHEDLSPYKSLLCLDGDLQYNLIKEINLPVIAADGAANGLIKNGIEPYVIIGDLDSVDKALLPKRFHVKIDEQNTSDFEKAVNFIESEFLAPAIVVGINEGCIDRVLGNIGIFSRTKFIGISKDIFFMTVEESKTLNVPINTKISIFGMPRCVIKSFGLKWELDNDELLLSGPSSCCNRAASSRVKLKISEGKALVFVYNKIIRDAGSIP
ncbi:MAG: thiamine diphosphokinase [Holosporaceae bacterium]|jgi:thiamine pyrophosphokinase|nr:thiamine diphosphokinase [Holosporaceae bacterium]